MKFAYKLTMWTTSFPISLVLFTCRVIRLVSFCSTIGPMSRGLMQCIGRVRKVDHKPIWCYARCIAVIAWRAHHTAHGSNHCLLHARLVVIYRPRVAAVHRFRRRVPVSAMPTVQSLSPWRSVVLPSSHLSYNYPQCKLGPTVLWVLA